MIAPRGGVASSEARRVLSCEQSQPDLSVLVGLCYHSSREPNRGARDLSLAIGARSAMALPSTPSSARPFRHSWPVEDRPRNPMRILGIETSCDETAAAVIEDGRHILSNVVASQADLHAQYGGIVPEVASRQHLITIVPVVRQALEDACLELRELDAVAVTFGPGSRRLAPRRRQCGQGPGAGPRPPVARSQPSRRARLRVLARRRRSRAEPRVSSGVLDYVPEGIPI